MNYHLNTPLTKEDARKLKAGDIVTISGIIYTARDAAHKRMLEEYDRTGTLPFDIKNQIIYYAGPSPAKPGEVIGAAGPTTSSRMDAYAPRLLDMGETGMIGKGARNADVVEAMKRNHAVYFGATGGAGALVASHIKKCEVLAYSDLQSEAIHKLTVEAFPVIVIIDSEGNNLYETERKKYQK